MSQRPHSFSNHDRHRRLRSVIALVTLAGVLYFAGLPVYAQAVLDTAPPSAGNFRIGEKLSYNVSFGRMPHAAYLEMSTVSTGRLTNRDAVELRLKVKTIELFRAAFFQVDENRTVYVAPDTGLPLYIVRTSNEGPVPKDVISNYLTQPASSYDLLSLIYKARQSGGSGTFPLMENDQLYTATWQSTVTEKVKTDAGTFDTTVSTVQSDLLTMHGIKDLRINFSSDEHHLPVLIRFKAMKEEFRASLAVFTLEEPVAAPVPVQTLAPTPVPVATPKPRPTTEPYVENKPLAAELGFQLGESLNYRITASGKPAGTLAMSVRERKMFQGQDSLVLAAEVTGVEPGGNLLVRGNAATVRVDPETLAPRWMESRFDSPFVSLKQTLTFEAKVGSVLAAGGTPVDTPIGTHTFLSLIYAMRSFNLKPSKDTTNPVNDTRVAVFWESKVYIFTLRPSAPADIMLNGQKVPAQLVSVNTGEPRLDAMAPKVWLRSDDRVPLRFSIGPLVADLIMPAPNPTR